MRIRTPSPPLLATALTPALAAGGLLLTATGPASAAATVEVTTAAQLKTALGAARPGDTIHLADGTYTGNFKATTPATASARITPHRLPQGRTHRRRRLRPPPERCPRTGRSPA